MQTALGFSRPDLPFNEQPQNVAQIIENLVYSFINDILHGKTDGTFFRVMRTNKNIIQCETTGAFRYGDRVSRRHFNATTAHTFAKWFAIISQVYMLLLSNKRISQRQLYYILITTFRDQVELNHFILDVSASLRVPRYALNIGAATRGVVAGCIQVVTCGSTHKIDCRYIGSNGWPIPGDVREVTSVIFSSTARYILVIEKFGIFTKLVQDRIYDRLPCILICGKGYPSVSTRAILHLMASRLKIPVMGLADFNPHGLALLQCYRRGSVRSGMEGAPFVCDVRWLGLRSSHIQKYSSIGLTGETLSKNDEAILRGLEKQTVITRNVGYQVEMSCMRTYGKYELQWLFGHEDGPRFLSETFIPNAILHGDYF